MAIWSIVAGVTAGTCTAVVCPVLLSAVGFQSAGVAAGSIAAGIQTPTTAAGSLFAACQSAGVLGMATSTTAAISTAVGATATAVAALFGSK